jgi:epoxyqueuosine reductase
MISNKELTKKVKQMAISRGAHLVGIAAAEPMNAGALKDHRPVDYMPEAISIIVIGGRMPATAVNGLPETRLFYTKQFFILNGKLNSLSYDLSLFLEDEGFKALAVPPDQPYSLMELAGMISNKHAAQLAGVGHFGINNLLLHPQYGPRVRLATIITNAPLEPDAPYTRNICQEAMHICKASCASGCPAGALSKNGSINKEKCAIYMWNLPKYGRDEVRSVRCGLCIKNCPVGSTLKFSK